MAITYNGTTQARAEALLVPYDPEADPPEEEPVMPVDTDRGLVMQYLSTVYAPYLITQAVDNDELWAFIEVDDAEFDAAQKVPTEDYLDQVLLETGERPLGLGPEDLIDLPEEERLAYFRDNIGEYASLWSDCNTAMGTYGYRGIIPQGAVSRAVLYDPTANELMTKTVGDVLVPTTKNFTQSEQRGIDLTSWFFAPVTVLTLEQYMGDVALPQLSAMPKNQMGTIAAALRDYSGITPLVVPPPPPAP